MTRLYPRIYTLTNDANADQFVGELLDCWETAAVWTGLTRDDIITSGAWSSVRYADPLSCVFRRERRRRKIAACAVTITPIANRGDMTLVCDGEGFWSTRTDAVAAALVAIGERRRRSLEDLTSARRRRNVDVASVYGLLRAAVEPYERIDATGDASEYGGRLYDDRPTTSTRRFVIEGTLFLASAHAALTAWRARAYRRSISILRTDAVKL